MIMRSTDVFALTADMGFTYVFQHGMAPDPKTKPLYESTATWATLLVPSTTSDRRHVLSVDVACQLITYNIALPGYVFTTEMS